MEQYIHLGTMQNIFFFLHKVYDAERFREATTREIMHCMINERMIVSPDKAVVVFEINFGASAIRAVVIQHNDARLKKVISKEELAKFYVRLILAERNGPSLMFRYHYDVGGFRTYETEALSMVSVENPESLAPPRIVDVEYVTTIKHLDNTN